MSVDVTADSSREIRELRAPTGEIALHGKNWFAKLFGQEEEPCIWQLGILIREYSSI